MPVFLSTHTYKTFARGRRKSQKTEKLEAELAAADAEREQDEQFILDELAALLDRLRPVPVVHVQLDPQ